MATILLAEDEPTLRLDLQETLEADGHTVVIARIGPELLQDMANHVFDLVITDLKMPQPDGWAVAAWLARHRPQIPVVAVSGFVSHLPAEQLRGFVAVLQKPYNAHRVLRTVRNVLAGSGTAPQ